MKLLTILFVGLVLAVSPRVALAQEAPNEVIAGQLADLLNQLLQPKTEGLLVKTEGKITVVPSGDAYLVKVPALELAADPAAVQTARAKRLPGRLLMAKSEARLVPLAGGQYSFSLQLPRLVSIEPRNAAGKLLRLTFESASLVGQWRPRNEGQPDILSLPVSTLTLKNARLADAEGKKIAALDLFSATSRYAEQADGTLLLSADGGFKKLFVGFGTAAFTIGALNYEAGSQGMRMEDYVRLQADLDKFRERASAPNPSPTMVAESFSLFTPLLRAAGASYFKLSFTDVKGKRFGAAPSGFSLQQAHLGLRMVTGSDGKTNIEFLPKFSGLQRSPLKEGVVADLIPAAFQTHFKFANLPLGDLADHAAKLASEAAAGQPRDRAAVRKSFFAVLEQAGAAMALLNARVDSRQLILTGEGQLNASAASPLGFSGKLNFLVDGIDSYMQQLTARANAAGGDTSGGQAAMVPLGMVQGIGQIEGTGRKYELVLGPTGSVQVNGIDLSALTGALR